VSEAVSPSVSRRASPHFSRVLVCACVSGVAPPKPVWYGGTPMVSVRTEARRNLWPIRDKVRFVGPCEHT
jgi:hypothetical protein